MKEFDLITIAEMTLTVSYQFGILCRKPHRRSCRTVVATFACSPIIYYSADIVYFYQKYRKITVVQGFDGLRPAVVALIAFAGLGILTLALWGEKGISSGLGDINITAVILVVLSIFALRKWKPNPIFVIIGTGFIGMIIYLNI